MWGKTKVNNPSVIADSSFYICFLDDIKKPSYLKRIITHFRFVIGRIVKNEISKSSMYRSIEPLINQAVDNFSIDENFGELLKPFFSIKEIEKGEDEVIALAYVFDSLGLHFYFILDDESARHFVEVNFTELKRKMHGTIGFIKLCCCKFSVLTKKSCIFVLSLIKKSKFRVREEIINNVIKDVENRC